MQFKEKLKLHWNAAKSLYDGFYVAGEGDAPVRAYMAVKKTAQVVYDMEFKKKVERLKKFFNERR